MKLGDYMIAVVDDVKTNATFLKDVGTHGKVFGMDELRNLILVAPACRIAMVGARAGNTSVQVGATRYTMGRSDTGQFRGPLMMIAFLIEQDWGGEEARDRVIKLADDFMTFIEHRTFGLSNDDAGPALVTGFDIFYSAEIDAQGAAIAAVTWEQEVAFGRNLHDEDMALLTGDQYGQYPSGQAFYPEKEWADKGVIQTDSPPLVMGRATPAGVRFPKPKGKSQPFPSTPDYFEDTESPVEHNELGEVEAPGYDETGHPDEE